MPLRAKYEVMVPLRRRRPPYSLIPTGGTVVQVGAPADTLRSGRSRGMTMALIAAKSGSAWIFEPDAASAAAFVRAAKELGLPSVNVVNAAVSEEAGTLTLMVDPAHPATNFVEGRADYSAEERARFVAQEVPTVRLDDALSDVGDIDVLSVTTNGAEREILAGAVSVLGRCKYVALARTSDDLQEVMKSYGFESVSFDDRGFTFAHVPR